jgi:hypothetical protein
MNMMNIKACISERGTFMPVSSKLYVGEQEAALILLQVVGLEIIVIILILWNLFIEQNHLFLRGS